MLIPSLVWGWILLFGPHMTEEFFDAGTAGLEIGRMRVPKPSMRVRILSWTAAPLALLLVMGVNSGYRAVVEQYIHSGRLKEIDEVPAWTLANILMVAVQPAIVEELFFRHLAFGAVRRVSGLHAAVWVSAVMFAVAHIYNPLGLPWLLVCGVVLGYFRAGVA
jgi:membrane protease YdiL (CAAX protease family)